MKKHMLHLFKQYRKSINPPYNTKGYFVLVATFLLLITLPITLLLLSNQTSYQGSAATSPQGMLAVKHVFIILMENEVWANIKGNASAPYINNTLLPTGAHAEQYYNPPSLHPSLPNYIWLEAGTNFGITDDNGPTSPNHNLSSTSHLSTLMNNAGISWKAYQENISGTTCPITDSYPYAVRHDPFMYFSDVTNNLNTSSAYCIAHVRPYTELATDLTNNTVSQYNFITPNVCNDGHDSCSPLNNPIKQTDTWLQNEISKIQASTAYQDNGAIFITWDEGEGGKDGPIGMIVLSPQAKVGYQNTIHYTHSSTLRSIEEIFSITPLLADAANATNLSDLFVTPTSSTPSPTTTPTAPITQTYYVDCAGNDSNNGTSPTTAWQSITKATSITLQPGDNMLFKKGCSWTGSLKIPSTWLGTATQNIIVSSYGTGALPLIQSSTNNTDIVQISGKYITVDGLSSVALPPSTDPNCQNNPVGHIVGFSFTSTAANDILQNSQASGGYAGVYLQGGTNNNHVLKNTLQNNIMMFPLDTAANNDAGAFGVLIWGDNNEVAYNSISGSDACSYDYGHDGSAVEIYGGQNNIIHHNTAMNDDAFTELGNSRSSNNTYAYNWFYSTESNAVFLNTRGAADAFGPVNSTSAYNNSAYLTGTSSQGIICYAGCTSSILKSRNNIMQATGKSIYADGQFDEDYDLFYGGQMQYNFLGVHSISGQNPQFVSPSTQDFHLQATSPAINKGTLLSFSYTANDLDGTSVPQGTAPDMGAYEYNSGSPTITPTTVTNTPTSTQTLTPTPTTGAELIQNGSFENTGATWLNPWNFHTQTGGAGTISQDNTTAASGIASAQINVTTANATSPWVVQLQQVNLALTAGTAYTISFAAKAPASRSMQMVIQDSTSFVTLFSQSVSVGTSWQTFSFPFTPSANANAFIAFNIAQTTGQIWIDNVHITTSGATTTPTNTPSPTNTPTPLPTNTPTPTSTPTPTPISGDINSDGRVDLTDFSMLAADYGKDTTKTPPDILKYPGSDINRDGKVDLTDFSMLARNYTG